MSRPRHSCYNVRCDGESSTGAAKWACSRLVAVGSARRINQAMRVTGRSEADRGHHRSAAGRIRTVLLVLLVLAAAGAVVLPRAGQWLVAKDLVDRADVAVVLSGSPVVRSLAAADLYKQGKVGKILVIPEPPEEGRVQLIALGLLDPNVPPMSKRILLASGVPADRITFLSEPADGTIVEARKVQRFFELEGDRPSRVVVISSKFASRRARFIFREVLGRDGMTVLAWPSPYDSFEPEGWWTRPRQALQVAMEYEKLPVNALTLWRARLPRKP